MRLPYGYPYVVEFEAALVDHTKKELKALAYQFDIPEDHLKIGTGSVKSEVVAIAQEMKADLIVVSRHKQGALARLLGSSAGAIVHGSACDVLVMQAD